MFDRFFRAVNAQTIEGSGLGLAISRKIVERYGGTIRVDSKLGEGATFTVILPVVGD